MDVYSIYNRLKFIYAGLSRALPGGYALPIMNLVVEITYRCNLRCSMCYQRNQERELGRKGVRPKEELSIEQIRNLVDQTPPWCIVIFSGGEPFCRKDLMDILAYTARKRKCHIVTNAALITKEEARQLVDLGLFSVGVSMDGTRPTHDAIRGIPGTFERTAQAFHEIREYRASLGRTRPVLNMKTVISSSNLDQISEIYQIGREWGADYCTFQLENNSLELSAFTLHEDFDAYSTAPAPIEGVSTAKLEKALRALKRQNGKGPAVRFIPDISTSDILTHYDNRIEISHFQCHTPWIGMNVSPYGEVFPCVNYSIGNVKNEPLGRLWNNARYRHLRQTLKKEGLFAVCIGCCDLERKIATSPSGAEAAGTDD